jgi:RsiW-degrading membrane proteinase PrsW (M82 family)
MLVALLLLPLYLVFATVLLMAFWDSLAPSPAWAICGLCVVGAFIALAWPKKKRGGG